MAFAEAKSISDLVGRIVWVQTNTSTYSYPRFGKTLEESWEEVFLNMERLRRKMGDARTNQALEMCEQARRHFRDAYGKHPTTPPQPGDDGFEDLKLGSRLMQDVEQVVRGQAPFSYPKELYRWSA